MRMFIDVTVIFIIPGSGEFAEHLKKCREDENI